MTQPSLIPDVALIDNSNQRLPCILVLDGSSSMAGTPINELNAGLRVLEQELKADSVASQRVQLLVIRFGGRDDVSVITDWTDASSFSAPTIQANGNTPLGRAVGTALERLEAQKIRYREHGVAYNRPWVFLLTDGEPTDSGWEAEAARCRQAETENGFVFFGIGIGSANLDVIHRFTIRQPQRLDGLKFRDLFLWLSASARSASKAAQGASSQLASPQDWLSVPT